MAGTSRRASSSSSRPVVEARGPSSKVRATTGISVSTSTWAGAEAGETVSGTEAGTASIKHTTNPHAFHPRPSFVSIRQYVTAAGVCCGEIFVNGRHLSLLKIGLVQASPSLVEAEWQVPTGDDKSRAGELTNNLLSRKHC